MGEASPGFSKSRAEKFTKGEGATNILLDLRCCLQIAICIAGTGAVIDVTLQFLNVTLKTSLGIGEEVTRISSTTVSTTTVAVNAGAMRVAVASTDATTTGLTARLTAGEKDCLAAAIRRSRTARGLINIRHDELRQSLVT